LSIANSKKNSENKNMTNEGITISEMVKATGLRKNTIEVRIHRLGIKPLSYEARYPADTLDKIQAVKIGRPKKPASGADKKPRKTL
jgi:hypothetical protein